MSYWDQTALEQLIGKQTVLACFDDNNVGAPDPGSLQAVQTLSDRDVDAALATEFEGLTFPLEDPPNLVVHASLLFGRAYTYERRPEYVKRYGTSAMDAARAYLEQLISGRKYLTDALGITETPADVGGAVVDNANRIFVDSPDGTSNAGDY